MCGSDSDMVEARLRMTGSSAVGFHSCTTASQMASAKSGSVPVKLSGVYSS